MEGKGVLVRSMMAGERNKDRVMVNVGLVRIKRSIQIGSGKKHAPAKLF